MKRYIVVFLTILVLFSFIPKNTYGDNIGNSFIDVKIGNIRNELELIKLSGSTSFNLYEKGDLAKELLQINDTNITAILNTEGDIELFDSSNKLITILPRDGSVVIGTGNQNNSLVQVDTNRYRDYITFLVSGIKLIVINHINIENYLYGVVPKEMPASWPVEALKAQALVARSFTYANLNKHINDGFNLCDTTHCQAYGGFNGEHAASTQAVIETYGEYVTHNGKIISTLYHSTSGGYTEDSAKVWGGSIPYLKAVEDSFSNGSPHSSWSIKMTPKELTDKVLAAGIDVGEIVDLVILEVSDAYRVQKIKLVGTKGETIVTGEKLRSICGTTFLKSAWFSVEQESSGSNTNSNVYIIDSKNMPKTVSLNNMYIIDGKDNKTISKNQPTKAIGSHKTSIVGGTYSTTTTSFVFNGRGYGHGVGMSQYGAMEMAKLGYNYNDIITHYYKGVEVVNNVK